MAEYEQIIKECFDTNFVNGNSEVLFTKSKNESFINIFKKLDGDKDNLISSFNLKKDELPANINKILKPIYNELKDDNETLNESEFCQALHHLYDVMIVT